MRMKAWGHQLHSMTPALRTWVHANPTDVAVLVWHRRIADRTTLAHRALSRRTAMAWARRLGVAFPPPAPSPEGPALPLQAVPEAR